MEPASSSQAVFEHSRVLVVSPHLDDAVLSCSSLLERPDVEVLSVFAGRPEVALSVSHDLKLGFADSDEAMDTRLAEDQQALEGYGVATRRLGHLDATYAGYPRPASTSRELRSALDEWLATVPQEDSPVVVLPAGTGHMKGAWLVRPQPPRSATSTPQATPSWVRRLRDIAGALGGRWLAHRIFLLRKRHLAEVRSFGHHDHLFVRDELLENLLAGRRATVVLYEELPYMWLRPGQLAVDELTGRLGLNVEELHIPVDTVAKASRIALYASQVSLLEIHDHRVDDPLSLPTFERFWVVDAGDEATAHLPR